MARLGKRERLAKRERLETVRRLNLVRKDLERAERLEFERLPVRERNWLKGRGVDLRVDSIAAKQHTKLLYIGRSPGTGKLERKLMPARFASAFMAAGHEGNKAPVAKDVSLVRVGTTPARKMVLVDKLTGERKFIRLLAKGKYKEVGRPDANPGM